MNRQLNSSDENWHLELGIYDGETCIYFRIDKDRWKALLSDNSDGVNMALLRQQQQRLAIVKSVKVFFGHQNTLRLILRQSVSRQYRTRLYIIGAS